MPKNVNTAAAEATLRRLFVYNGGFLTQGRIRRILELSGYDIRLGLPSKSGPGDMVGVWGHSPTAPRGEKVAALKDTPILRVEDAFLRSVLPGRDGSPPIGLHLDTRGVHFDPAQPSDLEVLLRDHPLDDTALLNRAKSAITRLKQAHLSKYNGFDPAAVLPDPGYVLVIDQTFGDASVTASRADRNTFREMLFAAAQEHPGKRILVKTHPETMAGHRDGYFKPEHLPPGATFWDSPTSPWALLDGALAVYAVSSQLGFEAILAGHRPVIFGQPFYIGWGLTDDRTPLDRRQRSLTRAQLFAAAMILYPRWYDPYRDRLCSLEMAIDTLEAETRAWRDDHAGWAAYGMRLWKRRHLQQIFGNFRKVKFINDITPCPRGDTRKTMIWAGHSTPQTDAANPIKIEDGFLRSTGLGAALIPPLSLVLDDLGIYYDPSSESRLERLINTSAPLTEAQHIRAEKLISSLIKSRVTKYNLPGNALPSGLPAGRKILVPGQVEDDASIRLGTTEISTNAALLTATRAANPAAVILYKPHPDVEAGLRPGKIPADEADAILTDTDAVTAIEAVDEVWTMTSTIGFEALLRGKRVTCLGHPFYAGWGLTQDRGGPLVRRTAQPDITALAHAVLIDYPRYFDPVTKSPCPVEIAAERLSSGTIPKPGRAHRSLAKLQGLFASYAYLWRRS